MHGRKMAEETRKCFSFKLTELQFNTMKYLFQHYAWDFEDCIVGHCKTFAESQVYDEEHDGD